MDKPCKTCRPACYRLKKVSRESLLSPIYPDVRVMEWVPHEEVATIHQELKMDQIFEFKNRIGL